MAASPWVHALTTRLVPPSASALIDSLRGVGYSIETAIADIIDNSITAGARRIDIGWDWRNGDPVAVIADDGTGIAPAQALEALRFGGLGPSRERAEGDLGRFGLGLKTASLSQCRRVSVLSRASGAERPIILTWDLDHVQAAGDRWELVENEYTGPDNALERVQGAGGTTIVWEKVDFGRDEDRPNHASFLADLERLELHLGMVFHRFLDGDARRLEVRLNDRRVRAWDPFLEYEEATIRTPEQSIAAPGGRIRVRGFVLPHRDRFRTTADYERAGGTDGWVAQQGFYVYRAKRLLSAGGWLGLGGSRAWTREEPSRLARLRVDIPNSADREWRIDVRKAIARPPDAARAELARIAADVRRRAREVFIHRGSYGVRPKDSVVQRVWVTNPEGARPRYGLDPKHPVIALLRSELGSGGALLDRFLDLVARTVPVERVWLDVAEKGVPEPSDLDPETRVDLVKSASEMIDVLTAAGKPVAEAIALVARMEPFDRIADLERAISSERK